MHSSQTSYCHSVVDVWDVCPWVSAADTVWLTPGEPPSDPVVSRLLLVISLLYPVTPGALITVKVRATMREKVTVPVFSS